MQLIDSTCVLSVCLSVCVCGSRQPSQFGALSSFCHAFTVRRNTEAFHFIINIYKENKYYISKSKTAVVIFTWEELVQVLGGLVPDKD